MEEANESKKDRGPRVLSFNLNALPLWRGSFVNERIDKFVSRVDDFDILLLQEVYPSSVLPYAVQKVVCSQSRLLKKLRAKGFPHYVVSRQPSYRRMLQHNIISNNGLVIVSRYPICRHGSYTFRNAFREKSQSVTYGCLFAEVEVPGASDGSCYPMVFFNIHTKPTSTHQFFSNVARQAHQFVVSVMKLLSGTEEEDLREDSSHNSGAKLPTEDGKRILMTEKWLPFVIGGCFNAGNVNSQSENPSLELGSLWQEFDLLSEMQNILCGETNSRQLENIDSTKDKEDQGRISNKATQKSMILATRTLQPFFSTDSRLEGENSSLPREEYLFASRSIAVSHEKIEKFVVGRRPYLYLSDHFGISAVLTFKGTAVPAVASESSEVLASRRKISSGRLILPSVVEETVNEDSPITLGQVYFSLFSLASVVLMSFFLSWRFQVFFLVMLAVVCVMIKQSFSTLPSFAPLGVISPDVVDGTAAVAIKQELQEDLLSSREENLKVLWIRAVRSYGTLPCILSQADAMGGMERTAFCIVDERVRLFGRGLFARGMHYGEKIGVLSDACREALILDLTCLYYGFASVSLAGKGSVVRSILDSHQIRVACSTSSNLHTLLSSRSTSLETIICLNGFPDEGDMALAKDLHITILSSLHVREQGRLYEGVVPSSVNASTVWSYAMSNVSTSSFSDLYPITHADVIRELKILQRSGLLGNFRKNRARLSRLRYTRWRGRSAYQERLVWYSPYGLLFPRLSALGVLLRGGIVATTTMARLEDACRYANPTVFIAQPALFLHSMRQMDRQMKTYGRIYRFVAKKVYNLCSTIIHTRSKDCSPLRNIFFRRFEQQLGGAVQKIILFSSNETTSFDVLEHATVCYVPLVRDVFYVNHIGICSIDGVPAPQLRVVLKPLGDELSARNAIGELRLFRGEVKIKVGLAARWDTHRHLTLLGATEGVLWPVDYQYSIAVVLERVFALSRYVLNIFVYCFPGLPLIAVVYPNKDIVEYAWRQSLNSGGIRHASSAVRDGSFGWKELVTFGSDIILEDLRAIGQKHHLHPSQLPQYIHLHPHAFSDHANFLNPFGKFCRLKMSTYFEVFLTKIYGSSPLSATMPSFHDVLPSLNDFEFSDDESSSRLPIAVPFTIDIGGTFAKIACIMPPELENVDIPDVIFEASSLSRVLGVRVHHFFNEIDGNNPHTMSSNSVGTIRFLKVPSAKIIDLASTIKQHNVLNKYKSEYVKKIRATGGGAFKYGHIARDVFGMEVDVVKEMDAVVKGLNLVLLTAPSSIFTVNPETGEHLPHKLTSPGSMFSPFPYLLINIGSGISFIKCTGPDGAHVRVGGSPIGGATFWGFTRALTHLTTWEEVLEIMRLDGPGDNKNVDLLVGDIYGYNAKDLPSMLAPETVASSFGKFGLESKKVEEIAAIHARCSSNIAVPVDEDDGNHGATLSELASKETSNTEASGVGVDSRTPSSMDIVRSFLNMLSGNVTQLAYLHSQLHGIKNIFFAGGFVRDNHVVLSLISHTLSYWSSGETAAHFLEHDGYLGALGCIVL